MEAKRRCLRCLKDFKSPGAHIRICPKCKNKTLNVSRTERNIISGPSVWGSSFNEGRSVVNKLNERSKKFIRK